jgi:hypothetical protein
VGTFDNALDKIPTRIPCEINSLTVLFDDCSH